MKVGFRSAFVLSLAVFTTALVFITGGQFVSAQEGAGIKVIPAFIENEGGPIAPGTTLTREISITNVSPEDKEYFIYERDIIGVEDGGMPVFADENAERTGYEITDWISFQTEPITVKAGETVYFPITIAVPPTAPPCSHFGGVFVSAEPPRLREVGAGVGYEVGSIINLLVAGECVDDARIRSFATDKLFYTTKKVNFTAKLENQGNILIRPRGPLEIRNALWGKPSVIMVNESLAGVFPGTAREFEFTWEEEGIGFGRYEAILALAYDGRDGQKTIDAALVFWVFPLKIILPILGGFITILLVGYFLTRYYINQAVMRAQGSRRITTYRYRRQVGISRLTFVFVTLMGAFAIFLIVLLILFA